MTYLNKNTELQRGYNTYIDTAEDDYGTMMDVGLLLMEEGDSFTIWEEEKECAVLLFQGAVEIAWNDKRVEAQLTRHTVCWLPDAPRSALPPAATARSTFRRP